jgi:thiamine-phosphate pyrophosphorylase
VLLERIGRALEAGPDVAVQHRQPGAPIREFLGNAQALAKLCAEQARPLFINGRLDVALALGAHLHLPAGGPLPAEVRPYLPARWISVAVHDLTEAAAAAGASFALVSPVQRPGSKPGDVRAPLGVRGFQALTSALSCPGYALGGVTPAFLRELRPAGAAVVSAVLHADDPLEACLECLQGLG